MPNYIPETESKHPVTIKVSKLAIIAISLASSGLIIFIICLILGARFRHTGINVLNALAVFSLGVSVLAVVLGIISLIRIEIGGGKITGLSFSIGAILIPIFVQLIPAFFIIFGTFKNISPRLICSLNLSGMGKAMLIYANDYQDELPRAVGKNGTWGPSVKWDAATRMLAYGTDAAGNGGSPTISASLYLLVKYAEVKPISFICKSQRRDGSGDKGISEFKPSRKMDLIALWDFGQEPWKHNSYSYHMPYGSYPLTTNSDPGMAVMADRNPWIPSPGWKVKDFNSFDTIGGKAVTKNGNTPCHQDEGQNVLFLDSHVDFETVSFCGLNEDNIYTSWNDSDIRKGTPPKVGSQPSSGTDSLLVNDPPANKP